MNELANLGGILRGELKIKKFCWSLLILGVFSQTSHGQTTSAAIPRGVENMPGGTQRTSLGLKPRNWNWTGAVSSGYYTPINTQTEQRDYGIHSFRLGLKTKDSKWIGAVSTSYYQPYRYEDDNFGKGDFFEPLITRISYVFDTKNETAIIDSLTVSASNLLPTSKLDQKSTFLFGLGASVSAAKKLGRMNFSQSATYQSGFYEYTIRDDGVVNSPHLFILGTSAGYNLSDAWSVSTGLTVLHKISYQNVARTLTFYSAGTSLALNPHASVEVGLATFAPTLSEAGDRQRLLLFDEKTSEAYVSGTVQF